MPPSNNPPPLLKHLYARTTTLGRFLASLAGRQEDDGSLHEEKDAQAYRDLLRQTVIALDDSYVQPMAMRASLGAGEVRSSAVDMQKVLDAAVLAIFEADPARKPSNQLTMGFTSSELSYEFAAQSTARMHTSRPSVYAKHLNTTHTTFLSPAWRTLLARVGSEVLVHVLTRTSVFVLLENGCVLQVAGTPVVDLKLPSRTTPAAKRKAQALSTSESATIISGVDEASPTRKKRRKSRNAQQRQRKAATPTAAQDTLIMEEDGKMLIDESEYSALLSPGFMDADIEAELNPDFRRPPKRTKRDIGRTLLRSPADLSFPRNRVFYARPMVRRARLPSQKRIVCGLPEDHVLNCRSSSAAAKNEGTSTPPPAPPHPLALLMHIFPRQFNLSNVFTTPKPDFVSTGSINHGDSVARAQEIEAKRAGSGLKIPKESRMRSPALQLLMEEIRQKWQKQDVWRFRAICCPSKIKPISNNPAHGVKGSEAPVNLPVEFVSQAPRPEIETSSQPLPTPHVATQDGICTQKTACSLKIDGAELHLPHGAEEVHASISQAQKFVHFTQPAGQVSRFVKGTIKLVFPLAVFGTEDNREVILKSAAGVEAFVHLRRYESLTLHNVLQGFKISDCAWLAPAGFVAGSRVTEGDARKRKELLDEFMWWFFDGFLIPLLKTNFYVTDSSAYRKEVLFFRQDDWEVICRPLLKQLQATVYKVVPNFEANRVVGGGLRQLGHSQLRLLPKDNGVRPIINLRRKPPPVEGAVFDTRKSINAILAESFSVLVHHQALRPDIFGSSILGADDIYPRLRAFRDRVVLPNGSLPRLYFAKVDVRSCFDTIEQSTLMDVLNELLQEDEEYEIVRFNKAKLTGGQLKKRFLNEAHLQGTAPSFPERAKTMSSDRRHEVLMDKAFDTTVTRNQVADLLREHIQNNTIKMGGSFYRQVKGIPQGSVVSTYLCSLFYGDMERKHLAFTQASDCMLVRLVDDFLLVTTDKGKAAHFVRAMHAGHPRYGCYVAPEKTLLSGFECVVLNQPSPAVLMGDLFPWCGRLINTRTLSMMGDYTRDAGHVKNTLTVDVRRNPGQGLRVKILRNIALKSSIAFNDTALNLLSTVYMNVHQNVAHCAMKAVHLCDAFGFDAALHGAFLLRIIDEVGEFAYATITNGAKTAAARAVGAKVAVDKAIVCWLAKHAFHRVLARKQTRFQPVLRRLALALEPNPCTRPADAGGVEGWEGMVERAWDGVRRVVY